MLEMYSLTLRGVRERLVIVFGHSLTLKTKDNDISPCFKGSYESGGEDGIRTHDTLLGYTHLANGRFRPLSHLSRSLVNSKEGQ